MHLHLRIAALLSLFAPGLLAQDYAIPWRGYDASVYPEGYISWGQRAGDFNADGFVDLAVVSWYSNSRLTILLGDGEGGFLAPVFHTLQLGARDIDAADMDGDGDLDLLVPATGQTWQGSWFLIFTNDGAGNFIESGPIPCGVGPNGIRAADFNGDGLQDVAVAHDAYINCASTAAVVYQQPGGGFSAPLFLPLDPCTHKLDVGDLNSDGKSDLVVAHDGSRISVLLSIGVGFTPPVTHAGLASGFLGEVPNVTLADVDQDTDLDVLYSHSDMGFPLGRGVVALYTNNGSGGLSGPQQIDLVAGLNGATDIEVADVSGDGVPDLLTANGYLLWCYAPGLGGGAFGPAQELHAGEDPIAIDTGDTDADGDLDVIVLGRGSLEACVYRNPGDGTFVQPPVVPMTDPGLAPTSHSELAVGDLDGDGDLDVVTGFSNNFAGGLGVSVRLQQAGGGFAAATLYPYGYFPLFVTLGDVDLDGDLDLVSADDDWPARVDVRLNNGSGVFGALQFAKSVPSVVESLQLYDVDGDLDLDLVVGSYGEVSVHLRAAGAWGGALVRTVGGSTAALAMGDFNGDGRLDLATGSGVQGYVEISLALGNGLFAAPTTYQSGRDVKAIAVGLIDSDNILDLACAFNLDGKGLSILRGRLDGSFEPPLDFHGSNSSSYDNPAAIALADLDADGQLDAVVPNYGSQDLSVWLGNGDGTFDALQRWGVGQPGWDVAFGDFTGDQTPDLLVQVHPQDGAGHWYYPGLVVLRGTLPAPATPYCTAKTTSNGCVPALGWTGVPTPDGNFTVTAAQIEPAQLGTVFYSTFGDGNGATFQGGTLCVTPPVTRMGVQNSGGSSLCAGTYAYAFAGVIQTLPAGTDVYVQAWFRDFGGSFGTGLSDGLRFTVFP